MRLGAYAGVMQARIIELRQESEDVGVPVSPNARAQSVPDDAMLAKLANEGWVERVAETAQESE